MRNNVGGINVQNIQGVSTMPEKATGAFLSEIGKNICNKSFIVSKYWMNFHENCVLNKTQLFSIDLCIIE